MKNLEQKIINLLNKKQLYSFKTTYQLGKLDQIGLSKELQVQTIQQLSQKYMIAQLSNGMNLYEIQKDKSVKKLQHFIIGQKTLLPIFKIIYPNAKTEDIIHEALTKGCSLNVDLLVDDIYGKNAHSLGLDGKIIASSLAKYGNKANLQSNNYDVAKSLIIAFAINIASMVSLALTKYNLSTVLILGDKIHEMPFYNMINTLFKKAYAPNKNPIFSKTSFQPFQQKQ